MGYNTQYQLDIVGLEPADSGCGGCAEFMKITNRNQFPDLLRRLNLFGDAVEVGSAEGYNAFHILDHWPGNLTMVDPYRILDMPGFSGHGESDNEGLEARYQRMVKQAARYSGRCKLLRLTSEKAAPLFQDGVLDFCYIDALHTREGSADDIRWWAPKIRPGGILGGHDHLSGFFNGQDYGVKDSVAEFAALKGLQVNVTLENDWPSWWVQL